MPNPSQAQLEYPSPYRDDLSADDIVCVLSIFDLEHLLSTPVLHIYAQANLAATITACSKAALGNAHGLGPTKGAADLS